MTKLEERIARNFERLKLHETRAAQAKSRIELDARALAKERGLAFMRFETLKQEFGAS